MILSGAIYFLAVYFFLLEHEWTRVVPQLYSKEETQPEVS